MANLRLVKIVKLENGTTEFQPAMLGADSGDVIRWDNETDEDHWPEQIPTEFLTDKIPPGEVSEPGFVVPQNFRYRCKLHPQEQGEVTVSPAALVAVAVSTPEPQAP